jgi:NAD+ kinase
MKNGFNTVAIVARRLTDRILESITKIDTILSGLGIQTLLEQKVMKELGLNRDNAIAARAELGGMADLVIVVGGDGSILGVSRDLAGSGVPVVGVNRGSLGFLAAISPDEIDEKFGQILSGDYSIEDHFLLEAQVFRQGDLMSSSTALNDVVVNPSSMSRMMEFDLLVNEEFVYNQKSDGIIVASPTGSTAYALSAGGPIMHPKLDALVVVPMFPHTLTSRPLVVNGDSSVTVRIIDAAEGAPQLSCDSQVNLPLQVGDNVTINKSIDPLKLLYPSGHSFYESCRSKLDWASRLGGSS